MKLITDEQVRSVLTMRESSAVVRDAFIAAAQGRAVTLPRSRTYLYHLTLSVMGGIVAPAGMCGAKVYSTNAGQFDFVVVLFDGKDGRYLGTLQGNALTEFRTAATTRVVIEAQMPKEASTLTIFGAGVQARAHLAALLEFDVFRRVFIVSKGDGEAMAASFSQAHPHVEFQTAEAITAVPEADVVITCTRSPTPLFDGKLLKPHAFVAAIGSSKPQTREIDDSTLQRATRIIVEHKEQARKEAGDLVMAQDGVVDWDRVLEIGEVLPEDAAAHGAAQGIGVYKSVGVGLVDVALSALVYKKLEARAVIDSHT
ncbi:ornithine cyclodeaminase family protein (plasmid) [Cupriavidus sp. P-10]|uniref:ornithine cyclodeaminase family protein n=1 Tax=Cupriavidus sp. P-10 TaxID=2027911 RepID=UPI000E2FA2AA|nr:ornithine cyclodeaminase family protein [Cupriavidus sp. P-10]BDB29045.1 ornithine cyclodeaminase family protein [Cupriavidus sp. P-10]